MGDIDNRIGFTIHKIDVEMKKRLDAGMRAAGYDEMTLAHGWILKYLYDHRDEKVYQKDIEKNFPIGRSTVTAIIQLMEKRELVRREFVENDARLKRVLLTDKGFQHHDHVEDNFKRTHEGMLSGLSSQEKETLFCLVEKIAGNIEGGSKC